jgi:hypothetical protein
VRRAYSGLSRRDRALDAEAMAERAKQLAPMLLEECSAEIPKAFAVQGHDFENGRCKFCNLIE